VKAERRQQWGDGALFDNHGEESKLMMSEETVTY
jgi:hypothetical protein